MRNTVILVLALLGSTVTIAAAQNTSSGPPPGWVQVASGGSARVSVDPSRITERPDGSLRTWTRWDLARPDTISGKRYVYTMVQIEIDCADARMRHLAASYYSSAGLVVESFIPRYPEWTPVIPDSVADGILREVCGYMEKPTG
jgi:hypothetical protein